MKLVRPFVLAFVAFAALACTKKPTPEFESEVSAWQRGQCSCYATSESGMDCNARAPRAELGEIEHLMVNAGVLTDARRDTVTQAENAVRGCAQAATERARERDRQKVLDAAKVDLSGLAIPPPTARGPKKPR